MMAFLKIGFALNARRSISISPKPHRDTIRIVIEASKNTFHIIFRSNHFGSPYQLIAKF